MRALAAGSSPSRPPPLWLGVGVCAVGWAGAGSADAGAAAGAAAPTLDEAMASAFDATDVSFRVSAAAGEGSK